MVRAVIAVVAGVVLWFVAATVLNLGLRYAWSDYAAVERTMAFTMPMALARQAIGAVSSVAAGYLVGRVAPGRLRVVGALVALLLVATVPAHVWLWDRLPLWYHIVFLGSVAVLPWFGAQAATRFEPVAAKGAA
jgi:hypothetical protein